VTLAIKSVVEWQHERELQAAVQLPPERPAVGGTTGVELRAA